MTILKNVKNKIFVPLVFFNEKKGEYSDDFRHWKSNFCTFWHLSTTPMLKIQSFPLGMLAKIFPIWYPPLENLTTHIAIRHIYMWVLSMYSDVHILINAYHNRISTNSMGVDLLVSNFVFKTKAYFSTVERRKQYFFAIIFKNLHASNVTILL